MTNDDEAITEGLRALIRMIVEEISASMPATDKPPEDLPPQLVPVVQPSPDRYVTAKEVAEYLGLPSGSVLRLTREGDIPALRAGRLYRYNLAEVVKALGSKGES